MNCNIIPCESEDLQTLCDRLIAYNLDQVPMTQATPFEPVCRKIVDHSGNIIAGCLGEIYCWNVMSVEVLWVDPTFRRQGLGSSLLRQMEGIALARGCSLIHLDTFDFQAKDFYLKQGYVLFGVLEDCPPGHCRYYLKKDLSLPRREE